MTDGGIARRTAARLLGISTVARAVRAIAKARHHGIALVYHRIADLAPTDIVPTVDPETFRCQLEALAEVASIVDLGDLVSGDAPRTPGRVAGPPVALTFDDDLVSHASQALPMLGRVGVRATFFLSGRTLVGEGAYWFQRLEALVAAYGPSRLGAAFGVDDAEPGVLALVAERDPAARARVEALSAEVEDPPVLDRAGIGAVRDAGMPIGFHTVDHVPLPSLADADLERALVRGRRELDEAVGRPTTRFAYPHGAVDHRARAAVRRAGFTVAWTGAPTAVRSGDDAFALGRWEPGPLAVDDFLVKLAVRLHRRPSMAPGGRR